MRIRTLLLILALVGLVALPALAQKAPSKTAPTNLVFNGDSRDVFEGFEGAWPPAGWTTASASGHVAPEAWYQGDSVAGTPYEGSYMATIEYDPDLLDQDATLSFYHMVAAGEDHLNFWISGSAYWSINYDCTVEINGASVYSWAANVVDNWVYQLVDIDLTAYTGQNIEIAFRYTGNDGAAIYLDAIGLNAGQEPPPPPEAPLNDTCEGASDNGFELLPGMFSYEADNTYASNDYPLEYTGSCTGYSATGNDVVYYVCLNQGDMLDVTMTCSFDNSLYIIADCGDAQGSCVAGADATVGGVEEILGFVAPADGLYYVIATGYSSSGIGPMTISGTNYGGGCVVATEETSFDSLKSMYR